VIVSNRKCLCFSATATRNLVPLAQPALAPVVPLGAGGRGGLGGDIAAAIILDVAVGLVAVGVLLATLAVGRAVGLRCVAAVLAAVGVAQAPVILRRACILARVGLLALAVGGAASEVLVVEKLPGVAWELALVVVAADAGELVSTNGLLTGPGSGRGAEAGSGWGGSGARRGGLSAWGRRGSIGVGRDGARRGLCRQSRGAL